MIEDLFDVPPQSLVSQIAESIKRQCQAWEGAVNDNEDTFAGEEVTEVVADPVQLTPAQMSDYMETRRRTLEIGELSNTSEDTEWRTMIKLDLQVGSLHLVDQFEWPLAPQPEPKRETSADGNNAPIGHPTPETFAKQLCADLGVGGEFVSIIAHSIREQICYARLNFDEAPKTQFLPETPIRVNNSETEWNPLVEELTAYEIESRIKEQERTSRRLRRSQRATTTIVINRDPSSQDVDDDSRRPRSMRQQQYQQQQPMNMQTRPQYSSYSAMPAQYAYPGNYDSQRSQPTKMPYRNMRPTNEDEEALLRKLEQSAQIPGEKRGSSTEPPEKHRGFGASAHKFNSDGAMEVGDFRLKWRCGWCLLSGKYTPTLRRGPMGSKTLCNACGIWYSKHGSLPKDRYHEHLNDH